MLTFCCYILKGDSPLSLFSSLIKWVMGQEREGDPLTEFPVSPLWKEHGALHSFRAENGLLEDQTYISGSVAIVLF